MVGPRAFVVGAVSVGVVAVAVVGTSGRAEACTLPEPPRALIGYPKPDEGNVPTNAVPVFGRYNAGILTEQDLPLAEFELASASGETVALTPRAAFTAYFELVPETPLEPSTLYTLDVTAPPGTSGEPSTTLSLSFTTGSGPLRTPAAPPDARIQHYHSSGTLGSTCDPGPDGSCIFFPGVSAVELWLSDAPEYRYLVFFGAWSENLTGTNQGTQSRCLSLRTRAADGTMSDTVEVCREDGETLSPPDTALLRCTDRGLEKNGVLLDGSGGASGGNGGTGTGGTGTSGSDTDDPETHTVVTEGCGCRIPGTTRGAPWAWLALGLSLAAAARRRSSS